MGSGCFPRTAKSPQASSMRGAKLQLFSCISCPTCLKTILSKTKTKGSYKMNMRMILGAIAAAMALAQMPVSASPAAA